MVTVLALIIVWLFTKLVYLHVAFILRYRLGYWNIMIAHNLDLFTDRSSVLVVVKGVQILSHVIGGNKCMPNAK